MSSEAMDYRSLCSVDDLLVERVNEEDATPLVAYPGSEDGLTDFLFLTAKAIDRFTNIAAQKLLSHGLRQVPSDEAETVALLGLSDLEFMITMFALSRLGYTVLILSPRLAIEAYTALLRTTGSKTICYSPVLESTVGRIQRTENVRSLRIVKRNEFDNLAVDTPRLDVGGDRTAIKHKVAFIMHSSGSTGLPKPIFQTHQACLENYANGHDLRAFLAVPLYHTHGHACLYRTIFRRKAIYLLNAKLPLTSTNLITVVEHAKPEIIFVVPYALKLLAESDRGMRAMQSCKIVSSAGSQIPDELGDRLVDRGIQLVSHWGSTETGALMNSMRHAGDKDWAYMAIFPSAKPFVFMKPLGAQTYELVVLDGLKSKIVSNSDDPPKSFHTRDTFEVHPTKPDRWKYTGRLDDRVTLINGEKVLPTVMEGRLREDPLIREAVVFGIGRALPGVLLFRSTLAAEFNDDDFVERLWPVIEKTNSQVESFAHITKETIVPLGAEVDYPHTDKGTVIRAQVYKAFEKVIDNTYDRLDRSAEGTLRLNEAEIEHFVVQFFKEECSIDVSTADTDFFSAGANSLHAIKLASFIRRKLYLGNGSADVRPSIVFEQATAARLARYLVRLQSEEQQVCEEDEVEIMASMIQKYSTFKQFIPVQRVPHPGCSVILTGATGSLGTHILTALLRESGVNKVYCLVRASTVEDAKQRILTALTSRGITVSPDSESRIVALPSNLAQEDLGLEPGMLSEMRDSVTLIIHNAWAVNFNLNLRSFEDQHIKGTYHLLNFALSVQLPHPARLLFHSSVAVANRTPTGTVVSEAAVQDLHAANMGYGQSKLVGEHIVNNASLSTGIDCRVIRIGQIVGDSHLGLWNDSESIPLIIRSALTLGCLPALNESCSWLPVDVVAKIILELGYSTTTAEPGRQTANPPHHCLFYNAVNPDSFSWTADLLPALRAAGLSFESVAPQKWVARLTDSEQDPELNPTIKLRSTYETRYGKEGSSEQDGTCSKDSDDAGIEARTVVFATENIRAESETMRRVGSLLREGYVEKFVTRWLEKWCGSQSIFRNGAGGTLFAQEANSVACRRIG